MPNRTETKRTLNRENAIKKIAHDTLGLETLEARKSDRLDFHEMAVWQIKRALEEAFEAGRASNAK